MAEKISTRVFLAVFGIVVGVIVGWFWELRAMKDDETDKE